MILGCFNDSIIKIYFIRWIKVPGVVFDDDLVSPQPTFEDFEGAGIGRLDLDQRWRTPVLKCQFVREREKKSSVFQTCYGKARERYFRSMPETVLHGQW